MTEARVYQDEALQRLQNYVDHEVRRPVSTAGARAGSREEEGALRVLEAGCGSTSHVDLGPLARILGIDVSTRQLRRNAGLRLAVQGDLHHLPVAEGSVDVVVCWDVVEHLHTPVLALDQMTRALRTGGHLILGFPNLVSMKGLLTRWTPHGFHVWVYRHVLGSKTAGTGDHGPFPTYLRPETTPLGLRSWAADRGMAVELFLLYESEMQRLMVRRNPLARAYVRGLGRAVQSLTRGRVRAAESDVIVALRKLA